MAPHPGARDTSSTPSRPATPAAAEDGEESPMTALRQATEVVDPVPGAGAPHLPQQPDLVQLLTPEGERVEHPDYALDVSDDELRALYRDLALVRRWDVEATALQRQGELGIWASLLGQEAAQVGAGRALQRRRHGLPDLPRARRRLDPRGRPAAGHGPVPRRRQRRLGPGRRSASTCTRSSSARSACTRPATPWACSATAPRAPSWPSSATARPARARSTRR